MSAITIRRATRDDRAAILDLAIALQAAEHEMHPSRRPGPALDPRAYDELDRRTSGDDGAILLAETDGSIAGYIAFYADLNDSVELRASAHRFLYVSDISVAPAMRGRGIAGFLLAEADDWCLRLGLPRIEMGVLAANAPALTAYKKAGYVLYEHWLDKHIAASPIPVPTIAGLDLRPMQPADRALMLRFMRDLADDEAEMHWAMRPGSEITLNEVERSIREIAAEEGAILIAELDGQPVGYGAAVCQIASDEHELREDWFHRGMVTDLYVAPEGRRRGIGLALLGALERSIAPRGLDWLQIVVSPDNAAALALYKKAGFGAYELVLEKRLG
ncbi:MAG: GNAT family N-acetyltransferase [Rhodospirillaceae bacterium]|nr:GNAT family N-acetyltransferase [Rhodospirillaceae bacterium]